ncbi:hypothetical protein [Desulfofundulus sp.]
MNSQKLLKQLQKRQKMFEEYLRQLQEERKSKNAGSRAGSRAVHK